MTSREERRRAFAEKLARLRSRYVAELPTRIAEMRRAATAGRWDDVRRIAHAVRGTGGSYGIEPLVQLTLDLEEACGAEDAEAVSERVTALEALCDELAEE